MKNQWHALGWEMAPIRKQGWQCIEGQQNTDRVYVTYGILIVGSIRNKSTVSLTAACGGVSKKSTWAAPILKAACTNRSGFLLYKEMGTNVWETLCFLPPDWEPVVWLSLLKTIHWLTFDNLELLLQCANNLSNCPFRRSTIATNTRAKARSLESCKFL